jgi:hypothetical protein
MRTNFDELRTIANDFATKMESAFEDLLSTANGQRRELIDLYGRMTATRADLLEFAEITDELALVFDGITEVAHDVACKIDTVMCDGGNFVPECNYEDFTEFCDVCGRAILNTEEYTIEDGGHIACADCHSLDEDVELDELDGDAETEDDGDGQMTFDLAETVSH